MEMDFEGVLCHQASVSAQPLPDLTLLPARPRPSPLQLHTRVHVHTLTHAHFRTFSPSLACQENCCMAFRQLLTDLSPQECWPPTALPSMALPPRTTPTQCTGPPHCPHPTALPPVHFCSAGTWQLPLSCLLREWLPAFLEGPVCCVYPPGMESLLWTPAKPGAHSALMRAAGKGTGRGEPPGGKHGCHFCVVELPRPRHVPQ